jgi:hypothetical protein
MVHIQIFRLSEMTYCSLLPAYLATLLWLAQCDSIISEPSLGHSITGEGMTNLTGVGMHVVKLRKRHMWLTEGDGARSQKTFYVGRVHVGQPQMSLRVIFDTASGQVVLPSASCRSVACLEKRRYSAEASTKAIDVNGDGQPVQRGKRLAGRSSVRDAITIGLSSLDLGDGKITGDLVRDVVCLDTEGNRSACAEVGMVAATGMTDAPFRAVPYDGIIGLGLGSLSIASVFNFLNRSRDAMPKLQFGLILGPDAGELVFGGHKPERLAAGSSLAWSPVEQPEEGYWQVRLRSVRIGNLTLDFCHGHTCKGILDTGSSRIGVPANLFPAIKAAVASGHSAGESCQGPDVLLELDGITLALRPEDYMDPSCSPLIAPMDLPEGFAGSFVLGEPVLRRYYAVFDAEPPRVGFGLAGALPAAEHGDKEEELREEEEAFAAIAAAAAISARAENGPGFEGSGFLHEAHLTTFMLQAMVMQVAIVFMLSLTSTYLGSSRLLFLRVYSALSRMGLTPSKTGIITWVPFGEAPDGDECVICLGSCEEDANGTWGSFRLPFGRKARNTQARPCWCRLSCGHHFHEQCIFEWLWKAPRCPVCRCNVFDKSVKPWSRADEIGTRGMPASVPLAAVGNPNGHETPNSP